MGRIRRERPAGRVRRMPSFRSASVMVMIFRILLPYVLPGVASGRKAPLTASLLLLDFAELMGATHGMGRYVQNSAAYANDTHAVAGMICIGIVVTGLNGMVSII